MEMVWEIRNSSVEGGFTIKNCGGEESETRPPKTPELKIFQRTGLEACATIYV